MLECYSWGNYFSEWVLGLRDRNDEPEGLAVIEASSGFEASASPRDL
jgi:hypothetical protein